MSITLYHGTLREDLPNILISGLKPFEGWAYGSTTGVFLSQNPETALGWAKMRYQFKNEFRLEVTRFEDEHTIGETDQLLVILEVTIPSSQFGLLRADMEQAEDVGFEGGPLDWEKSLQDIGDVAFNAIIPVSWIHILPSTVPFEPPPGSRGSYRNSL